MVQVHRGPLSGAGPRGCSSAGERLLCKQEVVGSNPTISTLSWQLNRFSFLVGVQVSKGPGWMPWLPEGMKGVLSCDKPGGGAKSL